MKVPKMVFVCTDGIVKLLADFIEQLLYCDIYHDIKLHSMLDVFGYIANSHLEWTKSREVAAWIRLFQKGRERSKLKRTQKSVFM